jgi:hypothetical protein
MNEQLFSEVRQSFSLFALMVGTVGGVIGLAALAIRLFA